MTRWMKDWLVTKAQPPSNAKGSRWNIPQQTTDMVKLPENRYEIGHHFRYTENQFSDRASGRRAYFLVIDAETRALEALPNPAAEAMDLSGGSTGSCLRGNPTWLTQ